jgi:hypothetical protein
MKILNRAMCTLMMTFFSLLTFAQDKKVDVNIDTNGDGSGFWGSPVVWVVGIAVFILLLVALLRNNSSKSS